MKVKCFFPGHKNFPQDLWSALLRSKAVSASISGIAGIGHILTGVGIVLLLSLRRVAKD